MKVSVGVVGLIIAVTVVLVLVVSGDDGQEDVRGVRINHSFGGGNLTSFPGQVLGFGSLRLVAPRGARAKVVGWRFGTVRPNVAVRYLLRPISALRKSRCPGGRIGFAADATMARKDGDRFPCDGFREAAGATVSGTEGWEMVAVFRTVPRGGVRMVLADPEVVVQAADGSRRTVRTRYRQKICVIGPEVCARVLRSIGFSARQARNSIRADCQEKVAGPLFVPDRFVPPRDPQTERGHDDLGRACVPTL